MRPKLIIAAFAVAALASLPSFAYAYNETGTVSPSLTDCDSCHESTTVSVSGTDTARQGPHGNYLTTTKKCKACHDVHESAGGGASLLMTATVTGTCNTCHDGTGGRGVYGVLQARGVTPAARHRIDTTTTVPGGDPGSGGSKVTSFTGGVGGTLGCIDCHSPHNASTVASFTGDRWRNTTDTAGFTSNRLLRRRPSSSDVTVTQYGSNWCGACHKGRLNTTAVHNHPSETTAVAGTFYYQSAPRANAVGGTQTVATGLGQNNYGYVMPYPRSAQQTGHYPLCQQCHEDGRSVGDSLQGRIAAGEVFTVTSSDGNVATNNPRFQVFPHEGANARLLVETEDDLCTNCHDPLVQLP